jgi:hypothetical protein
LTDMKHSIMTIILILTSTGAWCDFTCPSGTDAACLDDGDKVCPTSARCIDNNAVCFDEYICEAGDGYVCESRYDEMANQNQALASEFNTLASKHNMLLNHKSENERCVISADTLEEAKQCVLSQ